MASDTPPPIALLAGETPQALIHQDREVRFLREGVAAIAGIAAVVVLFSVIDLMQERPLQGLGGGMALTFALLFGPLLQQRLFSRSAAYVLTDKRLIVDDDSALYLTKIKRIRVWSTSITIHGGVQKLRLVNLVNALAVAQLIQNAVAKGRV